MILRVIILNVAMIATLVWRHGQVVDLGLRVWNLWLGGIRAQEVKA